MFYVIRCPNIDKKKTISLCESIRNAGILNSQKYNTRGRTKISLARTRKCYTRSLIKTNMVCANNVSFRILVFSDKLLLPPVRTVSFSVQTDFIIFIIIVILLVQRFQALFVCSFDQKHLKKNEKKKKNTRKKS